MIKKVIKVILYTCLFAVSINISDIERLSKIYNVYSNVKIAENNDNYNLYINSRKDDFIYRYKVVNKKRYRRLYNNTKRTWVGDWELVS